MLFRLVIDRAGPEPVHVFLPRDPAAGGPLGERVRLYELHPPIGRRFLGRNVRDRSAYQEFALEIELLLAGFEPAGPYRVCDSWDDYLHPWGSPAMNDQPTERMEKVADGECVEAGFGCEV